MPPVLLSRAPFAAHAVRLFALFAAIAVSTMACSSEVELAPCQAPTFPDTVPTGLVDVPYDAGLGMSDPVAFDVEASGLPAGLGPRLTGTPTAAGEFQVSLTVTTHHLGDGRLDSCAARTATKAYTLRIDDSPALCDSSTECAFLVSGFGGEACSSSRACPRGSACVRTGDAGRCHQSDSNVICGSGTRRLRTATIEGDLVETCVSDNKARKQCNERRHCVDAPLGARGTPCEVGIECATFSCFAGRCE